MKSLFQLFLISVCALSILISGCWGSGNIVPIAGTLTLDGEPMPGVEIVLSPKAVEGNSNPGPYSFGTTDSDGKFMMATRYGDPGAMIGKHTMIMQYRDIEPGAMAVLQDELDQARASGESVEEVKAEIEAITRKLKGRMPIPKSATRIFEVPAGGNENLELKLSSE